MAAWRLGLVMIVAYAVGFGCSGKQIDDRRGGRTGKDASLAGSSGDVCASVADCDGGGKTQSVSDASRSPLDGGTDDRATDAGTTTRVAAASDAGATASSTTSHSDTTSSSTSPAVSVSTMTPTPGGIPPSSWLCTSLAFGDGTCDCGCGALDVDCESLDDLEACERSNASGACAEGVFERLDPTNTSRCGPPGWTCVAQSYADGFCNCGCGVQDPDCADDRVESCDVCNSHGSCTLANCPATIAADNNSQCEIPEGWTCPLLQYGDGICHCGCGIIDVDCASAFVDECLICWTGCSSEACPGPIGRDDNSVCSGPPSSWRCDPAFYADGSQCHCGCGAVDPDCETNELDACERCNHPGSCSVRACPGTIDPNDIGSCIQPPPPAEWTCPDYRYADGSTCDCGCGAVDLDCVNEDISYCEACYACGGSCDTRLAPGDTTHCLPIPDEWTCNIYKYADGYACDCGCGALDPDCASQSVAECAYCPEYDGSCSRYDCADLDPEDNTRCKDDPTAEWTCNKAYFGDGVCDCGCAVIDSDCATADPSECLSCDLPGSCSEQACPGRISAQDNAVCD